MPSFYISFFEVVPYKELQISFVSLLDTVELGFKNRQDKNLLDFENQITNYQWVIYVEKVLNAKFDCT